jgi:hypothetical protein
MNIERDDADWIGRGECVETDSGLLGGVMVGELMGESLMMIRSARGLIDMGGTLLEKIGRQMNRLQVLYPAQ